MMREYRTRFTHIWQLISKPIQEFKVIVNGYRTYAALLSQQGTDPPVAIELENSIGKIVWTRASAGVYLAQLIDGFPNNATTGITSDSAWNQDGYTYITTATSVNPSDFIAVETLDGNTHVRADGILGYTYVEIKIYIK
jgi:hypothetical protein